MSKLNKSRLRRKILQQTQSISTAEWQEKSSLICDRLQENDLFKEARTILTYFSFRQEADLISLFSLNKKWGFPRCVGKSLVWHAWQPGQELQTGKYGIKEPFATATVIDSSKADLILVPTVACDRQGYRLGYGGGFYDRLLSSAQGSTVTTIGIVFDFAYLVQLPIDPWDMKLNFVCTETKLDSY